MPKPEIQSFRFLPCVLPLLGRKFPALGRFSLIAGVLFAALTMRIQPHLRYLYAAAPLATVVIASAFAALRTLDRPLYKVSLALAIAVFLLNLYFLPSADWFHKDYYVNASSGRARSQYLADHAPARNL